MEKIVEKKDLRKLFWRSFCIQGAYSCERMAGFGFSFGMLPLIEKLYPDREQRAEALQRHSEFFNSHSWLTSFIMGIVASMEEKNANNPEEDNGDSISAIKSGLMGPLAGIGDSVFWGTLRPICAGIAVSLAKEGNIFAPLLFLVMANIVHITIRYKGVFLGYDMAESFMEGMESLQIKKWMKVATILGLMVVGALVGSWLNVTTPFVYTVGESSIELQSMLDGIIPKIIPLGITLLLFYFVRKGKNINMIMLIMVLISFLLGFAGIIQ